MKPALASMIVTVSILVGLSMAHPNLPTPVAAQPDDEKPTIFVRLGHSSQINSVAFSPDGRYAFSGSDDGTMKLWDIKTGRQVHNFSDATGAINAVVFAPDGRNIVFVSAKRIELWDIFSKREVRTFSKNAGGICVAFSPDGQYIVSGSVDKTLKLWDVKTGKELRTYVGHQGGVLSVAFSPDGKNIVSGSFDKTIRFWDIETGKVLQTFTGHNDNIFSVAFSPDGKKIVSGGFGSDNTMNIWDVTTGKVLHTFSSNTSSVVCRSNFRSVAFSPDGKKIISGGGDYVLKLWDAETGKELRSYGGMMTPLESVALCVAISPDGRYILSGGSDKVPRLWDMVTGKQLRAFSGHASSVHSVAFSADGKLIISGNSDSTMRLWNASNGKQLRTFTGHSLSVRSVAFSPDNRYILSGCEDQTVKLWDTATGRELHTFVSSEKPGWQIAPQFNTIAFSPDGRYFLSGGWDSTIRVWDLKTKQVLYELAGHSLWVRSAIFSPDGRRIITASMDNTIKLWDMATGRKLRTFVGHYGAVNSVAFSPDGKHLISASADKTMKLWDVETGRELRTFATGSIYVSVVFSPDGRCILGCDTNTPTIWDKETGKKLSTFTGHSSGVYTAAFSPDGRYILSGSTDQTIKLWDISKGAEIASMISLENREWISIIPEGYFNASPNGPANINVRQGMRVFDVDQFYDVFYRPDIVEAKFKNEDFAVLISTNLEEALKNPPPHVAFADIPAVSSQKRIKIGYKITSTGGGIGEVRIFHNGKLIQSDGYYRLARQINSERPTLLAYNKRTIKDELRSIALKEKQDGHTSLMASFPKGEVYEGQVTVDAIPDENEIGLAAFNKNNTVQSVLKTKVFKSTVMGEDPHLFILSIGIDEFQSSKDNLRFAVKDAQSIAKTYQTRSATYFKPQNIHVVTLRNLEATKAGILKKANELTGLVKPSDTFVLFLASHGIVQNGLYSIITNDYDGYISDGNMLNSNEIMDISKNVKALTQIFILDTCHAGGLDNFISGLYDARMTVLAKNMGLHMFASASSQQEALDGYKNQNGLFTYTLLEGLNNNHRADSNRDGKVSIMELGSYSKDRTTQYSKEKGHNQTPMIKDFGKDVTVYLIQ